jgi:acetylornithine deacetylase
MPTLRASPASVEMIRRLVALDTTSRGSNLRLIELTRDLLADLGVDSRLVFDQAGAKANLYATLGPQDRPGLALSGHSDVVPVDGQDWSGDPWLLQERGGKLYGRGTADMKSFIAIVLAALPQVVARGLKEPLHVVVTYDEEVGCLGVRRLIEAFREMPVRPRACIIGEPTEMKVVCGHKGKKSVRCRVHGLECHSSLAPRGVNAIEHAAEVIACLRRIGRRIASDGPFDPAFDVPFTTVHTGVIGGGTALNIVPKHCSFDFEIRHVPRDDPEAIVAEARRFAEETLQPEMRAVDPSAGFGWEEIASIPGLDTPEDADIVSLAKALSGGNAVGKVAFGSEAGLYQRSGIETVICGPGSIAQAHKPDEFIALEQMALCERFLHRLMDRICLEPAA